ncbi:4a-hydroxytetrahydrobiopterin dehydratase [Thaumasiovibrio subtropicus]|uniref:4a-hydroxytetrahydrobiopterin dehydratase n=1 Tax=Thaumasiovibrio subtropicus TaxID=1891207 RepID=UPI000B34CC21|nr:4a-hydroxytetrahydrobiopterin dehydratase [Thaumasiovibrio subtropicus]
MLDTLRCEACSSDAVALTHEAQTALLASLADWEIVVEADIPRLRKLYTFKNFKLAWAFANRIAALAEEEFHHPTIVLEWGKVHVEWWSHSLKGLHKNDFICAAKSDQLLDE